MSPDASGSSGELPLDPHSLLHQLALAASTDARALDLLEAMSFVLCPLSFAASRGAAYEGQVENHPLGE